MTLLLLFSYNVISSIAQEGRLAASLNRLQGCLFRTRYKWGCTCLKLTLLSSHQKRRAHLLLEQQLIFDSKIFHPGRSQRCWPVHATEGSLCWKWTQEQGVHGTQSKAFTNSVPAIFIPDFVKLFVAHIFYSFWNCIAHAFVILGTPFWTKLYSHWLGWMNDSFVWMTTF